MKVSDAIFQLEEFMENFGDVEVEFDVDNHEPRPKPPPHQHPAEQISAQMVAWINGIHSRN